MVAVIHSSSSIRNALNYNEQKVSQGQASCLAAVNYPKDASDLAFSQKLARLQNQVELNSRTKVNSVHISLNFDPSEKLSEEKLLQISGAYLEKIGFVDQPYLVYAHHDAGHPHLHIVTTNIQANGKRISLHNLGKIGSEKARKEVEQAFGLVPAESRRQQQAYTLKPVNVQKVQYGKGETKRAITNVLGAVLTTYKYTSIPELNAILKQYNVMADRGEEGSRIYLTGGLTYRILDEKGNKIGVPIKASAIYNKPTLKNLEEKFKANEAARLPHKARVKNAVDLALLKNARHTLPSLVTVLQKDGIYAAIRQNEQGAIYGITYVDHRTKCVFNGSDLGKEYSAKGLQERCSQGEQMGPDTPVQQKEVSRQSQKVQFVNIGQKHAAEGAIKEATSNSVEELLQPIQNNDYLPHHLKNAKKKKRKRISTHL